jgi:hypothetical protein
MRAIFAAVLIVLSLGGASGRSQEPSGKASLVRTFNLGSILPVVCYDGSPAFIFAQNDQGYTVVAAVGFDGEQKALFRIAGPALPTSLACSADGATIAVLIENAPKSIDLFLHRSGMLSRYRLDVWPVNALRGRWSLLSEDGRSISLPATPKLLSGPDVIADMKLFVHGDGNTFFVNDRLIHDREASIEVLAVRDSKWIVEKVLSKEASIYINEVGRCFGHTLAVVANDNAERNEIYDLGGAALATPSWLAEFDFNKKAAAARLIYAATSASDRCLLAVISPKRPNVPYGPLRAFSVIDSSGLKSFSLAAPSSRTTVETTQLSSMRIGITKDGCFAVVTAFVREPETPQFTLPQQVRLFRLSGSGCQQN